MNHFLLALVLALVTPQADSPETLVQTILTSKDALGVNKARERLAALGAAGKEAVRAALRTHLQGLRRPPSPAELVQRLDATAVLDLEDYGADAAEVLEEALATAAGDRKSVLERILDRLRSPDRRQPAISRSEPYVILARLLGSTNALSEDGPLLVELLEDPTPGLRSELVSLLQYFPSTPEAYGALLAAADRRPQSVGFPLRQLLLHATGGESLDARKQAEAAGPWSRIVGAFRSGDAVVLERALQDHSSLVRSSLIEALPQFPVTDEARPQLLSRVLAKAAVDPSPRVRNSAVGALQQSSLDLPDVLLALLVSEPDAFGQNRTAAQLLRAKSAPSEKAMVRIFEAQRPDLLPRLSPLLTPARYPDLGEILAQAHGKANPKDQRSVAYVLARWGHEIGRRQIEEDLRSTDVQEVLKALDEIAQQRLSFFAAQAWTMIPHQNSQIASAARIPAVLLGAPAHAAEVEKMLTSDPMVRQSVARLLREGATTADLPLVVLLARSADFQLQEIAVTALEKLEPRELNDALGALKESTFEPIRRRADGLLGKLSTPILLPGILTDLTALDPRKRQEAQARYNLTNRGGLRYRIVDGPAALKDKIVDVPVETFRTILIDSHPAADEILSNLVPEPLPAAALDLKSLVRGNLSALVIPIVRRGNKEDVERLYAQAADLAEVASLAQWAGDARDAAPDAVDAFLKGWLRRPPIGARRDIVAQVLHQATRLLPPPQVKELLITLFQDERPEVHQLPVEIVKTTPALAFSAEAVAMWRNGKIKDKLRLYSILAAARSPEGEALLSEWLNDPKVGNRSQAAQALGRLLHADAIPILGDALFDWIAQSRWGVLRELSPGIAPRHQEAIQAMLARAAEEQKPFLDVLMYLSGSEAQRDRFLSLFPEDAGDRFAFIQALEHRPGAVDDVLVESLIRIEPNLSFASIYLKLLIRSDTPKAAGMAKVLMEDVVRRNGGISPEFGPACELLVRRLPEPPLELVAHFAALSSTAEGAVRALAALNSEAAVAQLIRLVEKSFLGHSRQPAVDALRHAKRFPALQKQLRGRLSDFNFPESPVAGVGLLTYLEGDADSIDELSAFLRRPRVFAVVRVAALQTILSIPGGETKVESILSVIPRDVEGSEFMIPEIFRVLVKGGAARPVDRGNPGARLLLAAADRDREAAGRIGLPLYPATYSLYREVLEVLANRALPSVQDAMKWVMKPGPKPTLESMAAELKAAGYEDARKALRDERPFIRANAAWLLEKREARVIVSKGPWLAVQGEPSDGVKWIFPGPSAEEIKALEKR